MGICPQATGHRKCPNKENADSVYQRSKVRTGLWLTSIRNTCIPAPEARGGDPSPRTLSSSRKRRSSPRPAEPCVWRSWLLWTGRLRCGSVRGCLCQDAGGGTSDSCPLGTVQSVTGFLWVSRGSPHAVRSLHWLPACSWKVLGQY